MNCPRSHFREPDECSMLRHVALALRRLDPTFKDPLRGGLRFRIAGLDLTPDIAVLMSVALWDPAIGEAGPGWAVINGQRVPSPVPTTEGEVPFQLDQTGWVGVADGRYRLVVYRNSGGGVASEQPAFAMQCRVAIGKIAR